MEPRFVVYPFASPLFHRSRLVRRALRASFFDRNPPASLIFIMKRPLVSITNGLIEPAIGTNRFLEWDLRIILFWDVEEVLVGDHVQVKPHCCFRCV